MKRISQLVLPGELEINVLFEKGKLAYTFEHDGKTYGQAVKLESKSVADVASAALVLFTSAIETKKALQ